MLLGLVVAVLLALTKHWLPPLVLAPLALVPAVVFVFHERRTPPPVFTHTANSIAANVAAFGAGVAFLGAETYLPLQLQVGFGDGVRVVGVALLLCTLGWTTGSMTAARLGARPRNQIALGTGLTVAATFVMAIPAGGAVVPIAAYTFSGLGMGIASPALFAAVLADGAEGREGRSTSSIPLARQVGSGMGAAIAGIVFAAALTSAQVHDAERAGAHVPSVVDAARLTYLGAAVVGRSAWSPACGSAATSGPSGPSTRWSSPRPSPRPAPDARSGRSETLRTWARSRPTSPPICGGSSATPASGRGSARPSRRSWPAATCSR